MDGVRGGRGGRRAGLRRRPAAGRRAPARPRHVRRGGRPRPRAHDGAGAGGAPQRDTRGGWTTWAGASAPTTTPSTVASSASTPTRLRRVARRRDHLSHEQGRSTMRAPRARRSELATPASSERMCEKAASSGADLVFLDLEDACAPSVKEAARAIAVGALTGQDWGRTVRAVRVNGIDTPWCHGDIIEVVTGARDALDVLIVPKVRRARDVWWVDVLLDPARGQARAAPAHRARGAHRGGRGTGQRARDRPGERPARGADLRGRRPLGLAARPGRRQLRSRRGLPGRLLALRPGAGAHRGPRRHDRRRRRAVPRLPGPRGVPALRIAGECARLRRQVGHPPGQVPIANEVFSPTPDEVAAARAGDGDLPRGRGRRCRRHRARRASWSMPPTCAWRPTRCTRRGWPLGRASPTGSR